jgi:hypothetical protein
MSGKVENTGRKKIIRLSILLNLSKVLIMQVINTINFNQKRMKTPCGNIYLDIFLQNLTII